ncbi:MAG TPA: hypothetical protein ENJ28_07070 [Gammaproteobacteria bacterium]|nr:hypothetical protein [Gammaproteobacteria bacterium]
MQDKKGFSPIVSEYMIMWEAINYYEKRLEKLSSMTTDEDQELAYDEKLQDMEGLLKSIKIAAKNDYELELK